MIMEICNKLRCTQHRAHALQSQVLTSQLCLACMLHTCDMGAHTTLFVFELLPRASSPRVIYSLLVSALKPIIPTCLYARMLHMLPDSAHCHHCSTLTKRLVRRPLWLACGGLMRTCIAAHRSKSPLKSALCLLRCTACPVKPLVRPVKPLSACSP